MAHEGLHEAATDLSAETRDLHRALVSLREELEAVDWYRQRADACTDTQLRSILLHHMRDEMEHSAMLIEWLRRNDADFADELRTYLYSEASIVETEERASPADEQPAAPSPISQDRLTTIGSLKETRA